mmetsp:Transcript_1421/g.4659  ORF Transcript_1421/g.4659 Transcript_1421/m.4659 type:complete len:287 (-) Transcript_1421:122-982(-)|eukprot:CAMPEP_0182928182 /NCGR_PEP_ID=MMETSP0105_2-20130417/15438_1 /TAXON_ID=81532 ORGANISM="Acanthoeca-like sp., Strain 10tr" /NCGR_SAMPLE_ID=MMETSP0105_2 /ASSEMBLY_ACC=CAM_ASM_000205 /LENGTH=286 /DNA_ID=CAMNT_0025066181 /DNA_START=241 /DNA_END=1101 /DNA_ORIENTATION=+
MLAAPHRMAAPGNRLGDRSGTALGGPEGLGGVEVAPEVAKSPPEVAKSPPHLTRGGGDVSPPQSPTPSLDTQRSASPDTKLAATRRVVVTVGDLTRIEQTWGAPQSGTSDFSSRRIARKAAKRRGGSPYLAMLRRQGEEASAVPETPSPPATEGWEEVPEWPTRQSIRGMPSPRGGSLYDAQALQAVVMDKMLERVTAVTHRAQSSMARILAQLEAEAERNARLGAGADGDGSLPARVDVTTTGSTRDSHHVKRRRRALPPRPRPTSMRWRPSQFAAARFAMAMQH